MRRTTTTAANRERHQYASAQQGEQLALSLEPKILSPLSRRSPVFYDFQTGRWNHKYLRVCAVYRLLRKKIIGQARAIELLAQRHTESEMRTLRGTVDIWRAHPLKDMLP